MATPATRIPLTAEAWTEVALDAIASGGIEAVAVEPLARRLGVTKGSFYWHFASREALLQAALARWEEQETREPFARAEAEQSPRERLLTLFRRAANTPQRSERVLLALSASDHPLARACVQRLAERWRATVEDCYRRLGCDPQDARNWATFAFSTYVGTVRLRRDNPDALPSGPRFNDYLRFLIRALIPRSAASEDASDPRRGAAGGLPTLDRAGS
ncbi:MAG TPA: TetR/AcrR family transcriptional regulator [Nevskiaceae bacterium]|nr:TetR/AcrR family transcriptional regulator [Nevskiaceae bacterium]